MIAVTNETKKLNSVISGAGAHDSKALESIFEKCRHDRRKMTILVRAFCEAYLVDGENRPLKMRPLQENIVVTSLTHPKNGKQRKMAILAPRGSGKSYALSIAATVYMFFKRFRDLVFILAPSEDQASLIFNYVYRHFADNAFLSGLVKNYRFHNKPNITLKGGTVLRRAPVAASNQGQAIRGQHPTFLIVDESPLISDKLFIDNVEPCIIANKAPFINLGTPKSKENHMWRYLYDDAYADTFTRLVYTWRDAVKGGRAYTPPYTESEMLDKMLEWGEDSIYWRTEYECEFVESVSQIFNPEAIKACRIRGTYFAERGKVYPNCTVAVDIGKSVNSTVISVWAVEKDAKGNIARLISLEEINPRTGGHDIPYQRQRIVDTARDFGAERIIIDATGIGGAIEQDIRKACYEDGRHFIPFVFTGGPKGTKTQAYRDYVSFIQQGIVKIPHPADLEPNEAKLVNKWIREHCELEYVMDAADKTERISAPDGKHDDYCDSSVMGIHACLSMTPASATFASTNISNNTSRPSQNRDTPSIFRTGKARNTLHKRIPGGL